MIVLKEYKREYKGSEKEVKEVFKLRSVHIYYNNDLIIRIELLTRVVAALILFDCLGLLCDDIIHNDYHTWLKNVCIERVKQTVHIYF